MPSQSGQVNGFNVFMQVTPAGDAPAGAATGGGSGPSCVIQYGSETLSVRADGRTIRQLFEDNAESLSFERNRAVSYRSNGNVVNGADTAVAGRTYVASVTYEQKGL